MEPSEHIKVAVRVRPFLSIEHISESCLSLEDSQVTVSVDKEYITSTYDQVFPENATQRELFGFVSPGVLGVPRGFNCTIFAYGQTGSGKTFTMFESNWEQNSQASQVYSALSRGRKLVLKSPATLEDSESFGIIPNSIETLFSLVSGSPVTVYCSFLQIYNEKLYDLLQDPKRDKPLRIRERADIGVFVENLAEFVVESAENCFNLLIRGDKNRVVRQTKLNYHSSRSHTIFQLSVESDKANKRGNLRKAKLNLCDLAGSEKYDKDNKVEHVKETTMINQSLSVLGQVIKALGLSSQHIPYRNSKITRLLQDSLGVSTRTYLVATVSPSPICIHETMSTLKFADCAREVMIKARKREVSVTSDGLINKLQQEIAHLRTLLGLSNIVGINEEILRLRQENRQLREFASRPTIEEAEKLKEENKQLKLQLQCAEGSSFFLTQPEQPLPLLQERMAKEDRCHICTLRPPCKHTSLSETSPMGEVIPYNLPQPIINIQIRRLPPRRNRTPSVSRALTADVPGPNRVSSADRRPKNPNIRIRTPNSSIKESSLLAELKLPKERKRQLKESERRLLVLEKLETYREERFKKKLEELAEKQEKEEEELNAGKMREKHRREHASRQKQRLAEHRETLLADLEKLKQKKLKEGKILKHREDQKARHYQKLKKKAQDYRAKKNLEEGILLDRLDDLASDLLRSKSPFQEMRSFK